MKYIFDEMDVDKSGEITWQQFSQYVDNEGTGHFLRSHGIVTHDAQQLFQLLDELDDSPSGTMDAVSFVLGMQRISGFAKGTDVILLLEEVRKNARVMDSYMRHIQACFMAPSQSS